MSFCNLVESAAASSVILSPLVFFEMKLSSAYWLHLCGIEERVLGYHDEGCSHFAQPLEVQAAYVVPGMGYLNQHFACCLLQQKTRINYLTSLPQCTRTWR